MPRRFQQNFIRLGMPDKKGKMKEKSFSKPNEKILSRRICAQKSSAAWIIS